jgi:hypothetical protein
MLTPRYFLNSSDRRLCFANFGENNYSLKQTIWGIKPKKTSGIQHIRESNIQLQLELIDGDLIIYAEFHKKWYKR